MVLVTACHAASPREGIDFLPLTVDYREYTYASGRIPGGFFKREGKPPEKEMLTSRLIDRPIRPLFPAGWRYETQIIALRAVGRHRERLGRARHHRRLRGAGAVGDSVREDDRRRARRPGRRQLRHQPDLRASASRARSTSIVAGSKDGIVMVEAGAKEVTETQVVGALEAAHAAIKQIVAGIDELKAAAGKQKLPSTPEHDRRTTFHSDVESKTFGPLGDAMRIKDKLESYGTVDEVAQDDPARALPDDESQPARPKPSTSSTSCRRRCCATRSSNKGMRLDGRKFDEIRPIWTEASVLPRVHGSVVFTRGETQALVTCTLGTADDEQKIEHVDGEYYKRFMLHYNFPPFSVGEVGPLHAAPAAAKSATARSPSARSRRSFPARTSSPTPSASSRTSSNRTASSSMASVCGGSMAMMDAGVPIKAPVAGIAMGLIMDEKTGKYAVLSDIAGAEDHYGDMDFKVAGTADGITALQMDIKVTGITSEIMAQGARPGQRRPPAHPRRDGQDAVGARARTCRRTRRASSPSRSRSTRSATSSAPAAR